MRYVPFAMFVSFALLIGALLMQLNAPKHPVAQDKPFPAITLDALEGNAKWSAASLQGRVTVLNFFASWCQPCAMEMPELAAMKKQFPGIHLQGAAWNDKPLALKNFLLNYRNPFEKVWMDKKGDATIILGIRGIPETFIIDGDGVVRYRIEGPLTEDALKGEVGAVLTKLLNEVQLQQEVNHGH